MIAPIQLTLESHIPMAGFQMALGVLNIGIAEIASVLVLGIEKVRFGLVMSLGTFAFIISKIIYTVLQKYRHTRNFLENRLIVKILAHPC